MTFLLQFTAILSLVTNSLTENIYEADGYLPITALIPARAGSKGITNKNLSLIRNETLLARTLRTINECGQFDSIWVSTDGYAIADEGVKMKANIHWRDPKTATDNASTVAAVEDFLLSQKVNGFVAVVQCTSPFLQKRFLSKAIEVLKKNKPDCIFSVTKSHKLRWTENSDGFVSPINFDSKKRPRRQDWKGELVENGMFYFVKKEIVLQYKILQNNRCQTIEIPSKYSLEIDTEFDLVLARAMEPLLNDNYKNYI